MGGTITFFYVSIVFGVVYLNNLGGVASLLVEDGGSCVDVMGEENVLTSILLYGEVGAGLRGVGDIIELYPFHK